MVSYTFKSVVYGISFFQLWFLSWANLKVEFWWKFWMLTSTLPYVYILQKYVYHAEFGQARNSELVNFSFFWQSRWLSCLSKISLSIGVISRFYPAQFYDMVFRHCLFWSQASCTIARYCFPLILLIFNFVI